MRMPLAGPSTALLLLSVMSAAANEPEFASPPQSGRENGMVKIEFTVSQETDVAVFIEDAGGKTVRHLAAGMLGKNAPEPLQPDSRKQSIEWDGKDDFGKPAVGGPFKARIKLGMKPEFDRFLMHNPEGSGQIHALAVGPRGTLFVFHVDGTANGNMGGHKIKLYDRDGKHLKVLTPFPADIAPGKVKPLGVFQTQRRILDGFLLGVAGVQENISPVVVRLTGG